MDELITLTSEREILHCSISNNRFFPPSLALMALWLISCKPGNETKGVSGREFVLKGVSVLILWFCSIARGWKVKLVSAKDALRLDRALIGLLARGPGRESAGVQQHCARVLVVSDPAETQSAQVHRFSRWRKYPRISHNVRIWNDLLDVEICSKLYDYSLNVILTWCYNSAYLSINNPPMVQSGFKCFSPQRDSEMDLSSFRLRSKVT